MKKILGLDLGTNSIGWALVNEAENPDEKSSIIRLGVRVNPLTVDEEKNFEEGKSITTNADRTLKRSMRRNLQRFKLRRDNLIDRLKEYGWITDETLLYENGNRSTFETYRLRARAADEPIALDELSRVLLMLNKKRGYKSNRKANSSDEGKIIDGMAVAKELYDRNLTPGQFVYELLSAGKKYVPAFYQSDLQAELDLVWEVQQAYYPDILTPDFRHYIKGKTNRQTAMAFRERYNIFAADCKEKDKRLQAYKRRVNALTSQLSIEEVTAVICDLNGAISNAGDMLGLMGDRSKELFFDKITVGQWLMRQLDRDPHFSLKQKTFYRKDYLDEFERIWETQAPHHPELTPERKKELRDIIIFYQRPLKSQKGLVNNCELETRTIETTQNGVTRTIKVGPKVAPKSSLLFQEFKIWQVLNNLRVLNKETGEERFFELDEKQKLFAELSIKDKLSKTEALKILFRHPRGLDLNYPTIEGNRTMAALYGAFQTIIAMTGHGEYNFSKMGAAEVTELVENIFRGLGFNTSVLHFDPLLPDKELERQNAYRLWHLLYSYEGDKSATGTESLIAKVAEILSCAPEYAKVVADVTFEPDYGSLSAKAIKKLLPHMRKGIEYSQACIEARYNHSKRSLTRDEFENKVYTDHIDILPRNNLRNPVVEKILNQMINVVNEVARTYGKPDEIRIEFARELKKNAKQRQELIQTINTATAEQERIRKILKDEFHMPHVSRNDILRYRLYEELKENGYKTLYSNKYIPREKIFSKEIDIEHIIPQARLFDDSFSNKTLEYRDVNIDKSDRMAWIYVKEKYGDAGAEEYKKRVDDLLARNAISRTKHDKLLMETPPSDFINRDLGDTRYISRKAREILEEMAPRVVATTGSITDRLREDWQIVDVMQELNWDKYYALGLTEEFTDKDGRRITRIKDWTKRNDHRHHAMDALTIAFTKPSIIQYLNNLNARSDKSSVIHHIEQKELARDGHNKLRFIAPFEHFRAEAKRHLDMLLISIKAKNKVTTRNINKAKSSTGRQDRVQLTPRGQLHNETYYGSMRQYVTKDEKVGSSFDYDMIAKVANQRYREALRKRLDLFDGNPKKAFTGKNSLDKNPLYLDDRQTAVPSKVKVVSLQTQYTIRKTIAPDLKIEKVIDAGIRKILQQRLAAYDNNAQLAFSNLDENPIYLNKEKGITIKRVTITGVNNAIPLHYKRDSSGNYILDADGHRLPVDYVQTGNNHHIAIHRDDDGNLQEHVVSFYEAVTRANMGLPIIDREYNADKGWTFLFTMKKNEYFVFPNPATGFNPEEIDLLDPQNYSTISPNLFRVQKFTIKDYWFLHHLETKVGNNLSLKDLAWKRIQTVNNLNNAVKVRLDHLGRIVAVGEGL